MAEEKQKELIPKPTKEQINEVVNPGLSRDTFRLGDKEIPIQIIPIDDEEKIILIFIPAIQEIFDLIRGPESPPPAIGGKVQSEEKPSASGQEKKFDMASFVRRINPDVLRKYSGVLKETILIMAKRHFPEVTIEHVGQNIHLFEIVTAIIRQFEKNRMADMVTSFFFKLGQMLPKEAGKNPPSP